MNEYWVMVNWNLKHFLETVPPQLKPSEEWPTHGCIWLQVLVYKYSTNSQEVLERISCCIEPTEKVNTNT